MDIRDEDLVIYTLSAFCCLLIILCVKINKKYAAVNAGIFLLYSIAMYYCLYFKSQYGASLAWLLYLFTLTTLQILIVGIYLIISNKRR